MTITPEPFNEDHPDWGKPVPQQPYPQGPQYGAPAPDNRRRISPPLRRGIGTAGERMGGDSPGAGVGRLPPPAAAVPATAAVLAATAAGERRAGGDGEQATVARGAASAALNFLTPDYLRDVAAIWIIHAIIDAFRWHRAKEPDHGGGRTVRSHPRCSPTSERSTASLRRGGWHPGWYPPMHSTATSIPLHGIFWFDRR